MGLDIGELNPNDDLGMPKWIFDFFQVLHVKLTAYLMKVEINLK